MHLRRIAFSYHSRKSEGPTARADRRKRFKTLAKANASLLHSLDQMNSGDGILLQVTEPDARRERIEQIQAILALLGPVFERHASAKLPRSREENLVLLDACRWLGNIYVETTGRELKTTTYAKGDDTREPQSPFGKLVRAFFEHADPDLDVRMLDSPLRKLRREQLKARQRTF